jgi:predicted O-methyltransferase YrrM
MATFSAPGVGQLTSYERNLLGEVIRQHRPTVVVEAGTWYGGGSTYVAACALHDNDHGHLWTAEIDQDVLSTAVARYAQEQPHLLPRITFVCGDSAGLIAGCPRAIDVFVCDGGDRMRDVLAAEPKMEPGGSMFFHDWHDAKEAGAREHIEASALWDVEVVVDSLAWVRRCGS